MGDPAGVGPEIAVKALAGEELYDICRPVVAGDRKVIEKALQCCGLDLKINTVESAAEGVYKKGILDLVDLKNVDINTLKIGEVQAQGGKAAFEYIKKSVDMALANEVDAIATTPINKESLKAAKVDYIGHTEILAGLTGTHDPLTMFEVRNMRVFFLTRHVSLRKACDLITKERLLDYIERCTEALKRLGITEGTMAVAGLNPHSGEHGLFGDEEVASVAPAVEEARRLGYDVTGPVGADSVFHMALTGRFNSVLSLYHDQGHIATKTLDFERTIALTIGLPFLRTSVDHGTAFDIAGTGKASEISMVEAILLGAKYSTNFVGK
jgi:4-hydroxythreonine-4-phosphate dehydrogenase